VGYSSRIGEDMGDVSIDDDEDDDGDPLPVCVGRNSSAAVLPVGKILLIVV